MRVSDSCMSYPQSSENNFLSSRISEGGHPRCGRLFSGKKFVVLLVFPESVPGLENE